MPFSFPSTRCALWNHQPQGQPLLLHPGETRVPTVVVAEKALRLAYHYAQQQAVDGVYNCWLCGSVTDDAESGQIILAVDTFQPGPLSDMGCDLNVPTMVQPSPAEDSVEPTVYSEMMKSTWEELTSSKAPSLLPMLCVRSHCTYKTIKDATMLAVEIDLVLPDTRLVCTPVSHVPILQTALSKNLSGPQSLSQVQGQPKSGFLTMDQTRKLLLVLESDPKVSTLPLVGIWVSGVTNLSDLHVWKCALRYLHSAALKERVCIPPESFLVVLYTTSHSQPEFYECNTRSKDSGIDFSIYTCHENIQLRKDLDRPDSPVVLELCLTSHGKKADLFSMAKDTFKQYVQEAASWKKRGSLTDGRHDDIMPWSSPSPHHHQVPQIRPSVPEVTLLLDESMPRSLDESMPRSGPGVNKPRMFGNKPQGYPTEAVQGNAALAENYHNAPQLRKPLKTVNRSPTSQTQSQHQGNKPVNGQLQGPHPQAPLQRMHTKSTEQHTVGQSGSEPAAHTKKSKRKPKMPVAGWPHGPQACNLPCCMPHRPVPMYPGGMPAYTYVPPQYPPAAYPHMMNGAFPSAPYPQGGMVTNPHTVAANNGVVDSSGYPVPPPITTAPRDGHIVNQAQVPGTTHVNSHTPAANFTPSTNVVSSVTTHNTPASLQSQVPVTNKSAVPSRTGLIASNGMHSADQVSAPVHPNTIAQQSPAGGATKTTSQDLLTSTPMNGSVNSVPADTMLDATASTIAGATQIPPGVYDLLRQQDEQLKMLREQLQQLMLKQNSSSESSSSGSSNKENAMPDLSSMGGASLSNPSAANTAERNMCSIAVNTSMWWPAEKPQGGAQGVKVTEQQTQGISMPQEHGSHQAQAAGTETHDISTEVWRGNETYDDTYSLGDLHLTQIQDKTMESMVSDMIVDMPAFPRSPDKSSRTSGSCDTGDSPILGESVSMYQEEAQASPDDTQKDSSQETEMLLQNQHLFYQTLIGNVKQFLAKHEENTGHMEDTGMSTDLNSSSVIGGRQSSDVDNNNVTVDVKAATLEHLKQLGINLSSVDNSSRDGQSTFFLDQALLPKIQYISMMLDSDSDQSSHLDTLAMKYLNDEQLTELAKYHKLNKGKKATFSPAKGVSTYGMSAGDMSFATKKYMEKYGLINGAKAPKPDPQPGQADPRDESQRSFMRVKNLFEDYLERTSSCENSVTDLDDSVNLAQETAAHHINQLHGYHMDDTPRAPQPGVRKGVPPVQRQLSDGAADSSSLRRHSRTSTSSSSSHSRGSSSRGKPSNRILDIERLKELPKLL